MSSLNNEGLKDERVPTFIAFESTQKKPVKRKRTAKSENRPNKKKALKKSEKWIENSSAKATNSEETTANQIWIGASIDEDKGAFAVYFGENDQRNCSKVFSRNSISEDIDYAYCLGTLKALEVTQSLNSPFLVNLSSRDLSRAIREKSIILQYQELLEKLYDLMSKNEQEFQVRHISGRHAPDQQREAINLAVAALENCSSQPIQENNLVEDLNISDIPTQGTNEDTDTAAVENLVNESPSEPVLVEKKVEEDVVNEVTTIVTAPEETNDKLKDIVSKSDDLQKIQQEVEQVMVGDHSSNAIVETTVETTIETKIEVKVIEPEVQDECVEAQPMEDIQKEEQTPPTGTSSWFGIRGIFDFISNPFKSRKSS